ncbi:hypothetical protein Q0812_13355 [Brevundimonas sp. 2R-24]|uniref:Uncharacterized protein n=1 Tax=Peiella sedimenti TaxID=3061083 RepID=A0ABT8SPT8_9CAUL|nr:hypothetical protein [Caulobacteraceae bacterium XZ-24]
MADLSITAASVLAGSDASIVHGTAGATVTAGQVLYLDTTANTWKLADNNSATAAVRAPQGIALNGAGAGQPLAVHRGGDITIGAALTAGVAYYLSDTPGGICPVADLASGEYPSIIGIAKSTTVLDVNFQSSGVAL